MKEFLQEERNAMRLFYTVKEEQMTSNNKIDLKQSKKEAEQLVVGPQEYNTKTDILPEKEEVIKRWEKELRERDKWIQQQEDLCKKLDS